MKFAVRVGSLATMLMGMMLVLISISTDSSAMLSPGEVLPGFVQAQDEGESIIFAPSADAYVAFQAPSENFGLSKTLSVDRDPRSESFIRFDVVNLTDDIGKATLRLWVMNPTEKGPEVWLSPNVSWSETEVTWNTRPAVDTKLAEIGEAVEGTWLEFDVTSAVSGNGSYSFALLPRSGNGLDVNSRDANENQPQLVITTTNVAGTPVAAPNSGMIGQPSTPVPSSGLSPVLLAAGDIASCGNQGDEQTAALLEGQAGTIAALGDTAYGEGSAQQYVECYDPTWGRLKDRTMPAVGNHEYRTEGASGYFEYFGEAAGEPGQGWYSYDLGEWHIIVVNSNLDKIDAAAQEAWLVEDLAANPVQCTIAYWHHPRFSSGEHGNNPYIDPLYRLIYQGGVDVLLVGHDHDYERFAPQNPDGQIDEEFGVRQFIIGTGGVPLRNLGPIIANSEAQNDSIHGVVRFTLNSGSYDWEFLPVEGESFSDSGSGDCHDAPPVATRSGIQYQRGSWAWLGSDTRPTFVAGRGRSL